MVILQLTRTPNRVFDITKMGCLREKKSKAKRNGKICVFHSPFHSHFFVRTSYIRTCRYPSVRLPIVALRESWFGIVEKVVGAQPGEDENDDGYGDEDGDGDEPQFPPAVVALFGHV